MTAEGQVLPSLWFSKKQDSRWLRLNQSHALTAILILCAGFRIHHNNKNCVMKKVFTFSLLIGISFSSTAFAQTFTEVTGTPFAGVAQSSIALADVDGDNDLDLLITGLNLVQQGSPGDRIAKLYTNDGSGNFTEVTNTPFDGVEEGSVAFADVDGDNDQDVLITGRSDAGRISKLYLNDGTGTFTEVMGTPFDGVSFSSMAFADVDGDNDQDVLMTGTNSSFASISKLYLNDGAGNFTEAIGTPFQGVNDGWMAFADVDGDNDLDVVITGSAYTGTGPISKLYTNDGLGAFTEMVGTPFAGVTRSSIAFADVDGDNDQDLLITGQDSANQYISKLYSNDGSGNFAEVANTPFAGLVAGDVAFADVDGDNDQDLLMTGGITIFSLNYTGLYTNDGSGSFTEVTGDPFDDLINGSIAFADVDGDNDLDVLITGQDPSNYVSKLYTNDAVVLSLSDDLRVDLSLILTPYPNPATSDMLNVRFNSTESSRINVRVYDSNGRLMHQQQAFAETGEQSLVVDISTLPAGAYSIQLEDDRKAGVARFMVQ